MTRARASTALAAIALIAVAAGCSSSGGGAAPPSFAAAPGTFRLTPHLPSNGAPPEPQLLTVGTTKVLVAFGGAFEQDHRAVAGMSVQLAPSGTASATAPTAGRYPAGAVIALGTVRVRVLNVYNRSGESHDLVDLKITST